MNQRTEYPPGQGESRVRLARQRNIASHQRLGHAITCHTHSTSSVVRLWNMPSGRLVRPLLSRVLRSPRERIEQQGSACHGTHGALCAGERRNSKNNGASGTSLAVLWRRLHYHLQPFQLCSQRPPQKPKKREERAVIQGTPSSSGIALTFTGYRKTRPLNSGRVR